MKPILSLLTASLLCPALSLRADSPAKETVPSAKPATTAAVAIGNAVAAPDKVSVSAKTNVAEEKKTALEGQTVDDRVGPPPASPSTGPLNGTPSLKEASRDALRVQVGGVTITALSAPAASTVVPGPASSVAPTGGVPMEAKTEKTPQPARDSAISGAEVTTAPEIDIEVSAENVVTTDADNHVSIVGGIVISGSAARVLGYQPRPSGVIAIQGSRAMLGGIHISDSSTGVSPDDVSDKLTKPRSTAQDSLLKGVAAGIGERKAEAMRVKIRTGASSDDGSEKLTKPRSTAQIGGVLISK